MNLKKVGPLFWRIHHGFEDKFKVGYMNNIIILS